MYFIVDLLQRFTLSYFPIMCLGLPFKKPNTQKEVNKTTIKLTWLTDWLTNLTNLTNLTDWLTD